MEYASYICGMLSVILCCTGVLSVPLGALGVLFALLTRRLGRPMPPLSVRGFWLSCTGMLLGILLCIYSVFTVWNDPEYRSIFEEYYKAYYQELDRRY